jgi:putative FmdB family regulatory protein
MPIYEYLCGKCGKTTEVIQQMKAAPPRVCPHCGGRLKKAFSAPAIQFKGSGFYITDYARAKSEGEKSAKTDSEGGEKPAEKTDKADKADKSEKAGDSQKPAKAEKPTAKSDKKKS